MKCLSHVWHIDDIQYKVVVLSLFGTSDWFYGKQFFYRPGRVGGWRVVFQMIQMHYVYCVLYFTIKLLLLLTLIIIISV